MAEILRPTVPQTITVHLGAPDQAAENVTVPFSDYIKNVASHEIYPTWPENAIRANIYAIISYALNRVYTEYYRSRGYNFDITNTTRFDQAYQKDGEVFENISRIVDEIFNNYITRQGSIAPLFSQFCNGTTSTCAGLSQWGTVSLANNGLTPYEILKRYYGNDINIETAVVGDGSESYPGEPLNVGDSGNNVKIIQTELNRISDNYPAIPKIYPENAVYGTATENAVRKFQQIFNLNPTGVVDKATWYKIKQYYNGVKGLSDLVSEGITTSEAAVPFSRDLRLGNTGLGVRTLQYYLNVISYFNPSLNLSPLDGVFSLATENAVKDFQKLYGLTPNGIVDNATWTKIKQVYTNTVSSLQEGYSGNKAKAYPGFTLSEGMSGESVRDLQTYLKKISENINAIPSVDVTGYFDSKTARAVETFQKLYGLTSNGAVGAVTWYTIAKEYDFLIGES